MSTTSIEWTDKTWGPVVGCTHKSPGCLHCYAETMAGRQVPMSAAQGRRSVYLRVIQPGTRKWSRPADVQRDPEHRRHVELLPERLAQPLRWRAGTRVSDSLIATYGEEQAERYRTGERYTTPEGEIDVAGKNPRIDLVIVGGESGPKARPMGEVLASPLDPLPGGDLVRSLRDQCEAAGVAFFFKQWGGVNKAKAGRMLDGRTHDAMPEVRRG